MPEIGCGRGCGGDRSFAVPVLNLVLRVGARAATHVGLVRSSNEDSALIGESVFAVADGMGGHAAGDVASALAVARLRALDNLSKLDPAAVRAYLAQANADIVEAAQNDAQCKGMGTTVAGLARAELGGVTHWLVFNVGDCRVYRYAAGELTQLTTDHTEVAELVAAGRITPEETRTHPRRNVVTRALGTDPAPEADVWILPSVAGERYLICSDGLTLEVPDAELAAVLAACPDAAQAAPELVKRAVTAGGRDNVTAIVVDAASASADEPGDDTIPRDSIIGDTT